MIAASGITRAQLAANAAATRNLAASKSREGSSAAAQALLGVAGVFEARACEVAAVQAVMAERGAA